MSKEKLKSLFDFTCLFTLLLILELRLLRREKGKVYVWLSLEMSVLHQQQLRVLWHCPICLSDWNRQPLKKGTAEHGLSISAGICCLEPFIKIITQLCISLQPLSLSHPSVRVHHWWSRVKLRRVQTWTWRSFTQYVTCLLCLYPKSTSELLCSFILDLSLSLDSFFLSVLLVSCWRDNMSFFFFFASNELLCFSCFSYFAFYLCTTRTKCHLQSTKLKPLRPCSCVCAHIHAGLWSPCEPHLQAGLTR